MRKSLLLLFSWISSLLASIAFSIFCVLDVRFWTGGFYVTFFFPLALIFGLSFLVGFVLWLVVLRKEKVKLCSNCGNKITKKANFCRNCGLTLEEILL